MHHVNYRQICKISQSNACLFFKFVEWTRDDSTLFLQVEASMVIEQCKTAISSLEHCKGLLQVDASHLEDNANELLQDFMMQQTMKQNNQGHDITLRQW